jgi:hypothetical protein
MSGPRLRAFSLLVMVFIGSALSRL